MLKNTDINNKHMSIAYTTLLYFSALINIRGFIVALSIIRVRKKKKNPVVSHVQKSKQLLN